MSEEEKIELTPLEAMAALNWKRSKIYYWISSKKFETVQKIDGEKILLTQSEINKLKAKDDFKEVDASSKNSEKVQKSSVQNITKNYETVQKNPNSETLEFFNKSLETIKEIHKSSLQNYGYSLKLLTDGKTAIEQENIELKQEKKAAEEKFQESLKQFEKIQKEKNIIIAILVFIILLACFMFFLVQNNFVQF